MQPTPSRRMPGPEDSTISQIGLSPSLLRDGGAGASHLLAADQSRGEEDGAGGTLDEVARREREDMRPRLRDELGREPTEEEIDEWLRRHTEGY